MSESNPTPDDYTRDPAADLETIRPLGAPIDSEALDLLLRYADKNSGAWSETAGIRSNRKFLPDYGDGAAIALACEYADAWLRRLIAAEEAILEMSDAWEAAECEGDVPRAKAAQIALEALAARIRAGQKGAP